MYKSYTVSCTRVCHHSSTQVYFTICLTCAVWDERNLSSGGISSIHDEAFNALTSLQILWVNYVIHSFILCFDRLHTYKQSNAHVRCSSMFFLYRDSHTMHLFLLAPYPQHQVRFYVHQFDTENVFVWQGPLYRVRFVDQQQDFLTSHQSAQFVSLATLILNNVLISFI